MKKSKKYFVPSTNKNAIIQSRVDRTGKSRTETARRDGDTWIQAAISTDESSNSTNLFVDFPQVGETVRFTGHEARTLYRLLRKHYQYTGKSRTA